MVGKFFLKSGTSTGSSSSATGSSVTSSRFSPFVAGICSVLFEVGGEVGLDQEARRCTWPGRHRKGGGRKNGQDECLVSGCILEGCLKNPLQSYGRTLCKVYALDRRWIAPTRMNHNRNNSNTLVLPSLLT